MNLASPPISRSRRAWTTLIVAAYWAALVGAFVAAFRRGVDGALAGVTGPDAEFIRESIVALLPAERVVWLAKAMLIAGVAFEALDQVLLGRRRWWRLWPVAAAALAATVAAPDGIWPIAMGALTGVVVVERVRDWWWVERTPGAPTPPTPILISLAITALALPFAIGAADPWTLVPIYASGAACTALLGVGPRRGVTVWAVGLSATGVGVVVWLALVGWDVEHATNWIIAFPVVFAIANLVAATRFARNVVTGAAAAVVIGLSAFLALDAVATAGEKPNVTGWWTAGSTDVPDFPGRPGAKLAGRPVPPGADPLLPLGWWVEVDYFGNGRPSRKKAPGTYRIVVQGSSSTEPGGVVDEKYTWTDVLERRLNEQRRGRPPVEVINAALGGSTTFGMLLNLKLSLLAYDPDMLLLYLPHSDATMGNVPLPEKQLFALAQQGVFENFREQPPRRGEGAEPATPKVSVLKSYRPIPDADRVRELFARLTERRPDAPAQADVLDNENLWRASQNVPLGDFIENLDEFIDICRARRIRLVIVGEATTDDITRYVNTLIVVAAANKVPFFDANARLPRCGMRNEKIFLDSVHLRREGHECVGRLIAEFFEMKNPAGWGRP
ncbi:MAG: hypothetical protein H6684_14695 [Deltaproteobacteria bacterium]|nr:hypothetical protein [Deltaproteobacteria bacterium]